MNKLKNDLKKLRGFLILWITQSFSALGSAMTAYALVIWSYEQQGSALRTSLLMVASYAPYVLLSVFAGAVSDKWDKKKTMLVCDSGAAVCTLVVLGLLESGSLEIWHLYVVNAINGLMNSIQQPASEVATTCILPEEYYQKVGGMRYFSNALNSVLTPIIATAVMGFAGIRFIIWFDLCTFFTAFIILLFFLHIPKEKLSKNKKEESLFSLTKSGVAYLWNNKGILDLILFLASINMIASIYEAAFPAMILSREGGSRTALGVVNTVVGLTTLLGSVLASFSKEPKSRIRVICNCLLLSMSTENLILALGRSVPVWCIGAFLGWIAIPLMSTNMDAVLRLRIPVEIQGRVFAARNTLQFFTIPLGYFLGGFLVDYVFEPLLGRQGPHSVLSFLFGNGKGSGAAALFFVIAFAGVFICFYFRRFSHIWELERDGKESAGYPSIGKG